MKTWRRPGCAKCNDCGTEEADAFYQTGRIRNMSACMACLSARRRALYHKDSAPHRERSRRQATKERAAVRETLRQMLAEQGGVCGICKNSDPAGNWHLDHDHACCAKSTRRACGRCWRGVLCMVCNTRRVPSAEDPHLEATLKYLNDWANRYAS
jgi:Recombination endonuclease VII